MKKQFKMLVAAALLLFAGNMAHAQGKTGYINFDQLLKLMPESNEMVMQMEAAKKVYTTQLALISNDLDKKGTEFQQKSVSLSDASRLVSQTQIQDINKRLLQLQSNAQQSLQARANELSKPIIDKARAALAEVAKENGYSIVINTSQTDLLIASEADNLMNAVKNKLGIK